MFYIAKIAQATGLAVAGIEFIRHFPEYGNFRTILVGAIIFVFGWIVERYMLKR